MTTKQGLQVPETNTTSLGLYVTPQEAYAMWKADLNIMNGLEGDRVDDPGSVYNGKHKDTVFWATVFSAYASFHSQLSWLL